MTILLLPLLVEQGDSADEGRWPLTGEWMDCDFFTVRDLEVEAMDARLVTDPQLNTENKLTSSKYHSPLISYHLHTLASSWHQLACSVYRTKWICPA